jgi:hypothetical protein
MVYHSNDSEEQAASSGDHDDQDTLDFLSTLESLSLESNDQAGSTELPPDYYYDGPIEGFGSDLGALIDGGTLSLPPFEDSDEEDSRPVDTEEYRRIAIGCKSVCITPAVACALQMRAWLLTRRVAVWAHCSPQVRLRVHPAIQTSCTAATHGRRLAWTMATPGEVRHFGGARPRDTSTRQRSCAPWCWPCARR